MVSKRIRTRPAARQTVMVVGTVRITSDKSAGARKALTEREVNFLLFSRYWSFASGPESAECQDD